MKCTLCTRTQPCAGKYCPLAHDMRAMGLCPHCGCSVASHPAARRPFWLGLLRWTAYAVLVWGLVYGITIFSLMILAHFVL